MNEFMENRNEIMENRNEIETLATYQDLKNAMDTELGRAAESFVRIGYLFKLARDTDILEGSGYGSYLEFAEGEYHMDKSQVSRFINIHNKFSAKEDPTRLREQYQGFGYAKLALMLTLPEEIADELTPEYSKADIQEIKEEVEAEQEISDLELLAEQGEKEEAEPERGRLGQVISQLMEEDKELQRGLRKALRQEEKQTAIWEALAPAGEKMLAVRIPGVGRLLLSVKGRDQDLALIHIRSGEKEWHSWEDLLEEIVHYCETHEEIVEEESKVAPVQLEKKRREEKKRKESKIRKAKVEEPKKEPVQKNLPEESGKEGEQREAGAIEPEVGEQMNIEAFPEWLPKDYQRAETGEELPENEIRVIKREYMIKICQPALQFLKQNSQYISAVRITEEGVFVG